MIANVTKLLSCLCLLSQVHWLLFGDPQPLRAPKPAIQNPESTIPSYQVLLFTADWCGPCRSDKRQILPHLERDGLNVSDDPATADVLLVDADEWPEYVALWQVTALPTYILVEPGGETAREVRRHAGTLGTARRFQRTFPEVMSRAGE